MKKRDKAFIVIGEIQKIFKCAVCGKPMTINPSNSLVCGLGHSFDLSRKGTLNLLLHGFTSSYSKELFEARQKVCAAGFYTPFIAVMAETLHKFARAQSNTDKLIILDAGCGEGSHLKEISALLDKERQASFVGVDISKESINIAAADESEAVWCVADLAKLPFQNHSFDVIINILSPANYMEFTRLIGDDGIVVKVVPGSQYLREIREAIYHGTQKNEYSSENILDYFSQKLEVVDVRNICYSFEAGQDILPDIIKMTPLTWGKDVNSIAPLKGNTLQTVTVDLNILTGRKKRPG